MKGTILILSTALLLGCSKNEALKSSKTGKPLIVVSIPPQAGLLKAIAGNSVEIQTLVGEGQSPHNYEPTAKQLAALGRAKMLFTIGQPFEDALLKKIRPLYPDLPIIGTDSSIEKRTMPHAHHGEHCTHDHGATDPHVWLSPNNCRTIAADMAAALAGNSDELDRQLSALDAQIRYKLAPFKGSRFYVFHPSFGYFADTYGLQQIPIELDGKSPSPRQLTELIDQAKADGVKVIFVQKQFPVGSAKAVADAIGGRVVQLDPLAEDVVANLEQIAEHIFQALETP